MNLRPELDLARLALKLDALNMAHWGTMLGNAKEEEEDTN